MSNVERQVREAHRRLNVNVLLAHAALGLLAGAGVWALTVSLERVFALGLPDSWSFGASLCVAGVVCLVGSHLRRVSRLQAAVAIDHAAGLKERLSTALVVARSRDPFAEATVHDAERAATGVLVAAHLPYRLPAFWPWSLAAALSALAVYLFMPELDLLAGQKEEEQRQDQAQATAEARAVTAEVNQQLAEVRKLAEENPKLADLTQQLAPLEIPERATMTPEDVRREALKRIDSVKDQLEREASSDKLSALKELQRQLARLEPRKGEDPASQLSQALASGDLEAAKQALEELQKKLEELARSDDPAARQKLAELAARMNELSEQLEKLADKTQMLRELENRAGLTREQAEKLMEQLSKMDPNQLQEALQKQLQNSGLTQEQLQQLAQKLAQKMEANKQCQGLGQCMKQAAAALQMDGAAGQAALAAGQALAAASAQLSELEMAEQQLAEMQAALAQLKELRESLCEGSCNKPGDGSRIGQQGPSAGLGYGSRIGREKQAHQYEASKARVQLQSGEIIGQMVMDGPQVKGEAGAEVRNAVNSAVRDAQDAIERQDVPRQYQTAVASYFERLAGLLDNRLRRPPAEPGAPQPRADGDEP
jgi:hypothetical protein